MFNKYCQCKGESNLINIAQQPEITVGYHFPTKSQFLQSNLDKLRLITLQRETTLKA